MKNEELRIKKGRRTKHFSSCFSIFHSQLFIFNLPGSLLLALITLASVVTACEREARRFREPPSASDSRTAVMQGTLQAGASAAPAIISNPYDENAYAVSEGKRLYEWFNCSGCHAHGGGDIGPPLMDAKWIYGSNAENIFATIVEGRPNGMPAFRRKIPDQQVWQLVAYVRSMSGQLRKDVSSGRDDDMNVKKSEQSTEEQPPIDAGTMKDSE